MTGEVTNNSLRMRPCLAPERKMATVCAAEIQSQSPAEDLVFYPEDWEIESWETTVCICGVPATENLIQCGGENCPIVWYHRQCAGKEVTEIHTKSPQAERPVALSSVLDTTWRCDFCVKPHQPDSGNTNRSTISTDGNEPNERGKLEQASSGKAAKQSLPKEKKTKVTWTPHMNKESLLEKAQELTRNCFRHTSVDPFYVETEIAAIAGRINFSSESYHQLSNTVVGMVWDCTVAGHKKSVGPSMNVAILEKFHELRCGKEILAEWERFLELQELTVGKRTKLGLLQFILRHLLKSIMKLICQCDIFEEEEYVPMSKEEEGVLRYVAGYVPFALVKRYTRVKSPLGQKYKNVLLLWKIDDDDVTEADTFLSYTAVWMTYQNRGGLFRVSDKAYRFFRAIEIVVRKQLAIHKLVGKSHSSREILETAVRSSSCIQKSWEILICEHLSREESEDLFTTIINYYMKIRMSSFVKLYVNLKKKENKKVSKKGEKGLRKGLKKSSKLQE